MPGPAQSIRTLAWLGDAQFELDVRRRLAARGDYATDRLDAMKADIVRASRQAELLAEIEPALHDDERDLVRRAKNTQVAARPRWRVDVRTYRLATAFEVLVAHWHRDDAAARYEEILVPAIERAIDHAITRRGRRPRRG